MIPERCENKTKVESHENHNDENPTHTEHETKIPTKECAHEDPNEAAKMTRIPAKAGATLVARDATTAARAVLHPTITKINARAHNDYG